MFGCNLITTSEEKTIDLKMVKIIAVIKSKMSIQDDIKRKYSVECVYRS